MKNNFFILFPLLALLQAPILVAQVTPPPFFQYQAIARNGSSVIANAFIDIQIIIRQGGVSGTAVYAEVHNGVETNEFGLFTLKIGGGVVQTGSNLAAIDWAGNNYWIQVGLIPPGGAPPFLIMGTTQLLSVPYALFAGNAGAASQWADNPNGIHYTSGNVGIGTADPVAGLSVVKGDGTPAFTVTKTAGNQPVAVFYRDPSPSFEPAMIITRQGNIGIGLSAPEEKLHLNSGLLRIDRPDFGAQSGAYFRFFKGGTERGRIGLDANNGLSLFRGGTDISALSVNTAGNIGIGTINPEATLQVNGTVRIAGVWENRSPGTVYQAPTDGFVVVRLTVTGANKIRAEGFTSPDAAFTESEIRAGATAWSNADVNSFTLPVAKGEFWKVDITAQDPTGTNIWVQWRPLGLGN